MTLFVRLTAARRIRKVSLDNSLSGRPELHCEAQLSAPAPRSLYSDRTARADAIRRDFTADAARINTRWRGDITYLATWEGWLYLLVTVTVTDIASRRVVGFALADHLRTELVADALARRCCRPRPGTRGDLPLDRGCQYTSAAYAALAGDCQVTLSAGCEGQCWDNAVAESFFASLKGELIDTRA